MTRYQIIVTLQAFVWILFGLFGKLLPTNSRHVEIVGEILNIQDATLITQSIGIGEIILGCLILSGIARKAITVTQVILVIAMNVLEFMIVPHLLLYGKFNILFALAFASLIVLNEFKWERNKKITHA